MLLKTKKGVGKRTQNELKNKADFECPMHTWNDGAEKNEKPLETELRSCSKQGS
jgi:hypothetical protein